MTHSETRSTQGCSEDRGPSSPTIFSACFYLPHNSLPPAPTALIYRNSPSAAHLQLGFPTSPSAPSSPMGYTLLRGAEAT